MDSVPAGRTIPERARDARALIQSRGFGVISTLSTRMPGFPFGSILNFAADPLGRPVFVISSLAVHTRNLEADPRASLTVYAPEAESDVLAAARMTLTGEVRPVPDEESEAARAVYFARHPDAAQYMEFADFSVHRMEISGIYYVGGFGNMGTVMVSDYSAAGAMHEKQG